MNQSSHKMLLENKTFPVGNQYQIRLDTALDNWLMHLSYLFRSNMIHAHYKEFSGSKIGQRGNQRGCLMGMHQYKTWMPPQM
jgi:hypothetical protein